MKQSLLICVMVISVLLGSVEAKTTKNGLTQSRLHSVAITLETFLLDMGQLPAQELGLLSLIERPENSETWQGPYVANRLLTDAWGNAFIYRKSNRVNKYFLCSKGANEVDELGKGDDICTKGKMQDGLK